MGLIERIIEYAERHPVFSSKDLRECLNVDKNTLNVILSYLVKRGSIIRLFRGRYTVHRDIEFIAPYIYFPSYISLFYALHMHGILEQVPRAIHIVTTRRPQRKELEMLNEILVYSRIKPKLFFGYTRKRLNNHTSLVATPEKALLDTIYFYGPQVLDAGALHLEELNKKRLIYYACFFPRRVKKTISDLYAPS